MAAKWDRDRFMKNLGKMKEKEDAGTGVDKRLYKIDAPKEGKSVYRVRVLPSLSLTDSLPWVSVKKHQFKGPTGWFFENCPTTLGEKCPIDEFASVLFNTGDPADEQLARKYYRKKRFLANILVISDKRDNGANEGKVFVYEFGQKLYDKMYGALFPEAGIEQLIFMDPFKGYDLIIVAKTVDKFPNYDESQFVRESTPIATTDEGVAKIMESCYDLAGEFLAPKYFKSYEQLDKEFKTRVLNVSNQTAAGKTERQAPVTQAPVTQAPQTQTTPPVTQAPVTETKQAPLENLSAEEAQNVFGVKQAPAATTPDVDPFLAELEAELNQPKK